MNQLQQFEEFLCGHFDNSIQLQQLKEQGITDYPKAEHINTVINDKITDLPNDFKGLFVLEESYYNVNGQTNAMPHLFLVTEEDNKIKLVSYALPEGYTKETFTYSSLQPISFNSLVLSEKFTPILYDYVNDTFTGRSESMFSPVLKFTLDETFSKDVLQVSEIFEVNGKRTFGYDIPLEYRRI